MSHSYRSQLEARVPNLDMNSMSSGSGVLVGVNLYLKPG